jgi:hypothetical protein
MMKVPDHVQDGLEVTVHSDNLVASVWVHERQHTGQTMSKVMAAFRERFNKAPPRRATVLDWEKRTFAPGSLR